MKNCVKWRVPFIASISLLLAAVCLPQIGIASTSDQPAMPLSISIISNNNAEFTITTLGRENTNRYAVQGKRMATGVMVASPNLCSIIGSHHRFFSQVDKFISHFKAFQKACLTLDLPPPYTAV